MARVSNEKKNLNRLAGEFLVASRLAQQGFMVSMQWGTTIGYDILVFDKTGKVAFIEVKSSALYSRRWILQKKYSSPEKDAIPLSRRFICCVDLATKNTQPDVYVFPAEIVAKGLTYYFNNKFPDSDSIHLSLDFKPQHRTKDIEVATVGEYINAQSFLENFAILDIDPVIA